jgi:hypothetical protein
MSKIISIIGSRETPSEILSQLTVISEFFAKNKWTLRTGGAVGADDAGLMGFKKVKDSTVELYLPWQGYNEHYNGILWSQENWNEASKHHPVWDELSLNSKIFHSRNIAIALGVTNQVFTDVVICWTLEGEEKGGSAMVIKLAKLHKIPLFNLGNKMGLTKLRKWCKVNVK